MALLWAPGPSEWIIIVIGVLVLFGATRVPQFMRGVGQGIKEFKSAISDDKPGQPDEKKEQHEDSK